MNAYLNYLLEASIGLCMFLLVYQLFLRKETSFRFNRIFLLIAILASVTFPLLRFNTPDSPVPSLNFSVEPATAELVYAGNASLAESNPTLSTWEILAILYATGLLIFTAVFIVRLSGMLNALKQAAAYTHNNHRIVELKSDESPFSFFNYIFIGNTPPLTEKEKRQIIEHESIHATLYHSFDILLLHALGIIFWFNPVIRIYKKIFVQLHEFEADARAVEAHDVDEYCSLLAKVALHSADYKLANHFSNSLTVKRIEMMRTLKQKIKSWKVLAVALVIPVVFFVVSCQDQVETPTMAKESKAYPVEVQKAIDRLVASNPEVEYIVAPPSGPNLKDFEGKHAKHLSYINGEPIIESESIVSVQVGKDEKGNAINYVIFVYNNRVKNPLPTEEQWKEAAGEIREEPLNQINGEPIFFAVEKQALPKDGFVAFNERIKKDLQSSPAAKRAGLTGSVFVKVVVTKDGTLTNFEILKSISKELDQEAIRLIKMQAQGWKPATQNGKAVHSQIVLPVIFK